MKLFKAAFIRTVPVMFGYIFLGIAYGILLSSKGYGVGWAFVSSLVIYAGAMQFVATDILASGFAPLSATLMTLTVNARHIFYGLSMLDRFKGLGAAKPYMIFSLTDETYSLLCSTEIPEGMDRKRFMLTMSILDHGYWVTGSVIGAALGSLLTFEIKGVDFAMTALFIAIFVEQWEKAGSMRRRLPAIAGVAVTVACRIFFGEGSFILVSLAGIFLCLIAMRPILEGEGGR